MIPEPPAVVRRRRFEPSSARPPRVTVATSEPPQTKASRQTPSERRAFIWLLAALGLGAAVGLFFGESVAPLRIVSEGFIRLLQVTVVPYVLGSILAGLGSRSLAEARALAVRGGIVLLMFWVTGLALVVAGSLAYPGRPPPATRSFPRRRRRRRSIGWRSTSRRIRSVRSPTTSCRPSCCSACWAVPRLHDGQGRASRRSSIRSRLSTRRWGGSRAPRCGSLRSGCSRSWRRPSD